MSLTFVKSYADCPQGWTSSSVTYTYQNKYNNPCPITVYYCSIIQPTGISVVKIDKIEIGMPCGKDIDYNDKFWAKVEEEVANDFMMNGNFPPCPLEATNVVVKRAECWKVYNNVNNHTMDIIDCGLIGRCEFYYKICTNISTGKNQITLDHVTAVSTEACPNVMPEMPPNGYTWEQEWTTSCYGITCPDE